MPALSLCTDEIGPYPGAGAEGGGPVAKMKQAGGVAARVEALVRPAIEGLGLRLWDVRYEKEGPDWVLKVLIDRPGGLMDTDTCEAASRAIDPILDAADPIPNSYMLEVGSPGLGRRLTRPEHFEAVAGQKIAAGLYKPAPNGGKELTGILLGADAEGVQLETSAGEVPVSFAEAAWLRLCDDENLFG